MANLSVIRLNGGKFTPLIDARSDIEKYSSGCRILENMIPRIYGPVERRPGTVYNADVENHDVKSKMIPFIFSSTIAYELEFSDKAINIYFEGVKVANTGSPYLESELFQLQFAQTADVMRFTHPNHRQRSLSRTDPTTFVLEVIEFNKGPFRERNDIAKDDDVTIAATGYSIATATAGAAGIGNFTITGSSAGNATAIGALFTPNQRFYVTDSTGNDKAYTVHATTATTIVTTTVTVYTNETVADGTNDGEIMVDGGTVTLTASSGTFESGHVNALFKLIHKIAKPSIVGTATGTEIIDSAIDVKGAWTLTSDGNWGGKFEIQRLEDGTNWETFRTYTSILSAGQGSFNAQKSDVEEEDGVQYRISAEVTGGTLSVVFEVDASTQDSIFRVTAVGSDITATATAIVSAPENTATKRWADGAWSEVHGYPAAVTFHEERSVYGFTKTDQQGIWPSETGRFEDFEAGTKASDSFGINLPTANKGRWLASLQVLAAGTAGDEWVLQTPIEEPLKPTNFTPRKQTKIGSAELPAMEVNEAILFIDFVARKIHEFTFSDAKQKYVSPDLTALVEDITEGGITSAGVQRRPDSIVWFTTANSPYLNSMTYDRIQDMIAFSQHPLGGDGIAESVCVTPGAREDRITLTVRRSIRGNSRRFIETMQPRNWGSNDNDAYFVDAGVIDTSGGTVISGLGHLEGETVVVKVDGARQADKLVVDGEITIDKAGNTVHAGLNSTYRASPMRMDITTPSGTTSGSIMKTYEVVISFFKTSFARYGNDNKTIDFKWRTTEDYDSPVDLVTDFKKAAFDGGFSDQNPIIISGDGPFPCTIRSIIARTDKTGR